MEYKKYLLRFDPLNEKVNIRIKSVVVKDHYRTLMDISGERDGKVQQLKVYSNCDSVEMFVNGKSIGNGRKQQSGVFVWDDVLLSDTNSIKAVGTANGKKYSDSVDEITANNRALAVSYKSHVQNIGWQSNVKDGKVSGTTGEKKQIEALQIKLLQDQYSGSIEYRTHVQNIGWQEWVKDGATAGTTGRKLRVEALQIGLTGEWAEHYDIYPKIPLKLYTGESNHQFV